MALGLRGATEGGEVEPGGHLWGCQIRPRLRRFLDNGGQVSAAHPSGRKNYTRVLLPVSILLNKHDNLVLLSFALSVRQAPPADADAKGLSPLDNRIWMALSVQSLVVR